MLKGKTVSLVMPCYNEEEGLKKILSTKPSFIDEVIVVDNGSEDKTAAVAIGLNAKVVCESKKGYGYAYQRGLPEATGDIIVTMDADDTYPLEDIEPMVDRLIERDHDFISGCRFPLKRKDSMKWINQRSNAFIVWAVKKITQIDIDDLQSGMWVFKRSVLDQTISSNNGMGFSQEIKLKAWAHPDISFSEYHIDYRQRIGSSKFRRLHDGFRCLADAITFLKSYRTPKKTIRRKYFERVS